MQKVPIYFIYSEGCTDCAAMLAAIVAVTQQMIVPCDIVQMLYSDKKAITIAAECGVDDLPCCIIGEGKSRLTFVGKKYSEEAIAQAIEIIWRRQQK
jgi:hypothetical protein